MYRQLQRQSSLTQIYCSNEQWCDLNCGKFHTRPQHFQHSQVRQLVGAIEMAAFSGANKEHPKLTIQTKFGGAVSAAELQLSPPTSLLHNGANLSLALPPVSPYPASPGSQTSNLSTTSMVTLDDIIASARRKISGDFKEIRLPSPEYEEDDSSMWDKRAARKKLVFHASSLDIPAMEQQQSGGGDSPREGNQYEDQESELQAELFIQEEPPLFFGDEESEDFEEQIKASKPPMDAFSNPILLQDSDPLTMRKKRRQRNLLRQQSKSHLASPSRIHQLGSLSRVVDSGSNAISQRSTPSGQQTGGEEDLGDNSSIDMSMAELSAAVAQGKSPSGSNGPSPSNILQFIEEQKQKGAVTVGIGSSEL